ncbi:OpgC domain-containing protein [Caballeronia sp. LZ001]|uniref:OpgC domain-containing protein n=1 Tax=Caballeronia sp. LZ001 TaxID=3038553 RepID=UPI002855E8EF|nr:OpgC domain-containing protein [Caballeronia sp. LZ001]MDR5802752.1 OpgC domain-containing protein [Caballeronia sp. LZ001]
MSSPTQRSLEVDFFRGVVLLIIAVDHISGSVLSHFTLHQYAFCDSAEVFVFLGGYASAAAYTALATRRSAQAARRRFFKRSWEIYRAYLLTAVLMLIGGALLMLLKIDSPMLRYTEWPTFLARPVGLLFDITTLRQQPYLSSVLPMYSIFALAVPFVVPLAERKPVIAMFGSLLVWLAALPLARALPSTYAEAWSFNPFAWQLMFVMGILARVQPVSNDFHASRTARWLTCGAIAIALTFAFFKLFLETQAPPGYLKQNLATLRIVSFAAVAWVIARAVYAGWIKALAAKLPGVVTIGQQGLVCFIAGTCVSLVLDSALRAIGMTHDQWIGGLAADALAVGTLLWLAHFWAERKRTRVERERKRVPLIKGQPVPAHAVNPRDR